MSGSQAAYRALPKVDALAAQVAEAHPEYGAIAVVDAARVVIGRARAAIGAGDRDAPLTASATASDLASEVTAELERAAQPSLRAVLNATGVIIHTNLGRAPLPADAVARALGYCGLEFDLAAGRRGSRRRHAQELLTTLSGAEAALVVNNNAAAVFLMLAGLCAGREVVISRGELVEIGGSFRVPDIMAASGCLLREVGTTNRTYARDYAAAITPETAAVLRVHPSNFRVTGFTHRPESSELLEVAAEHGVRYLHDLGAATLAPLPAELDPGDDLRAELAAGADVVCFSGDKLLGGPQAGILLGRRDAIDALAAHPLARALRADKLTLAALEHVLIAYRIGALDRVPVARMLHTTSAELWQRAHVLATALDGGAAEVEIVRCDDPIGGGAHPGEVLAGWAVAVRPEGGGVSDLARRLRLAEPAVAGVITEDRLLLHMRTVAPQDLPALTAALLAQLAAEGC